MKSNYYGSKGGRILELSIQHLGMFCTGSCYVGLLYGELSYSSRDYFYINPMQWWIDLECNDINQPWHGFDILLCHQPSLTTFIVKDSKFLAYMWGEATSFPILIYHQAQGEISHTMLVDCVIMLSL
jgi:hypothetical protein